MDFINSTSSNIALIDAISNSKFLNLSKQSLNKDIFRIGKKGVKVVLKKINGSSNYNKVDIAIKPHYYINNDQHNGDQLNIVNLVNALREIAYKLNIEQYTKVLKPTSTDVGVNIIPDQFDSKDIVNQALYFYKKPLLQVHSHLPYFKSTKKKETYPTISAKIYHKGLQHPNIINPNTLRFENMFCTAEKLQRDFKIHSYNDLLNPDIIRSLYSRLLKSWEHILILDQLQNDSGIHDIRYYENEFHYRNGLRNARINYYQQFGYWHTELKKQLTYEIEQCFFKMQIPALIDSWNLHKTEEKDIVGICTKRNCNVTGLDISMQKKGSKFLCISGLKSYYKNNPNIYSEIAKKYLTKKMKSRDFESQLYFIAHNIRNTNTNKIHNPKYNRIKFEQRNYPPNQLQFNF